MEMPDDPAETERPKVKFADVGGMEHVKEEIRLKIIYPLQHADLYRLAPVEVEDLGLEELMVNAVLAVEWPDRWSDPPATSIRVSIEPGRGDHRTITVTRGS